MQPTSSSFLRLASLTAVAALGASCAVEEPDRAARTIALDDRVVEVDAIDQPAPGVVTAQLRDGGLGVLTARADLDAAGRGTVVITGAGLRHEVLVSDTLLRVTSERDGVTELAYLLRPRGDLLAVLADYPALAPDPQALPAMPLHRLALGSAALAGEDGDDRWDIVARATWALDERADAEAAAAAAVVAAQPEPGTVVATSCQIASVSGNAKIKGSRSPGLYMAAPITCTDGPIAITANTTGGGNFTKTEQGITWVGGETPLGSCPGHCGDPLGGATCYKSYVSGTGAATLTGVNVFGDGGNDTATGPSCTLSSSVLNINLVGPSVSADATSGTTSLSISASVSWEDDIFSNDFCEASGSGTSKATLTGGGGTVTCTETVPTTPTQIDVRDL